MASSSEKSTLRHTMDSILEEHPKLFDVTYNASQRAFTIKMTRLDLLKNFDTVEVDISVNPKIQPTAQDILSSDYLCDPYEYYVRQNTNKDGEHNVETSYTPITNGGKLTA